eukprot:CAMPEP_0201552948 /NCGR_PEP_ID=MMETSP0173_2-20130828/19356_1 /ASSEMBLY_ACC=CAM_ASM_000268 /TAXON_ID=218659 /ORGANISM="Vexillifera sp., Strain DIVA3 564/2" /LENGTH=646 /DNA_ID=CAMNT_0047963539 /DNA_START=102 /DNA_END=2039 /DNA_ORIENTATION=-
MSNAPLPSHIASAAPPPITLPNGGGVRSPSKVPSSAPPHLPGNSAPTYPSRPMSAGEVPPPLNPPPPIGTPASLTSPSPSGGTNTSSSSGGAALSHDELLGALKKGLTLATRQYAGQSYADCFAGREAVDLILQEKLAKNRAAAVSLCRLLLRMRLYEHVSGPKVMDFLDSDNEFFRFTGSVDAKGISFTQATAVTIGGGSKGKRSSSLAAIERQKKRDQKIKEKEQRRQRKLQEKEQKKLQRRTKKLAKSGQVQEGPDVSDYFRLIRLLIDPDGIVATALCRATPSTEADFVAKALLQIFNSTGLTNNLVNIVIQTELDKTIRAGTLFRGNSLASKVMTGYSRLVGKEYLTKMLSPILDGLFAEPENSFEINPSKLKDSENLSDNMQRLLQLCKETFDAIRNSASILPVELKAVCHFLNTASNAKFPGSCYFAVGGFYFLRFLGPVIVSPDAFGVTTQRILPKIRRALVLVSKTLQTLSNGVEFGKKEEFMMCMNEFIVSQRDAFNQFIDDISVEPPSSSKKGPDMGAFDPATLDTSQLGKLAKILNNCHSQISTEINAIAAAQGSNDKKNTTLLQEFNSALKEIIPPETSNIPSTTAGSSSSASASSSSAVVTRKLMPDQMNASVLEPTLQKKITQGPRTSSDQ